MLDAQRIGELARALHRSMLERTTVAPLSDTDPGIEIDDACRISRAFLALREAAGPATRLRSLSAYGRR